MNKAVADAATTISAGTGIWSWLAENEQSLGIIISAVTLLIAFVFYLLNYLENRKRTKAYLRSLQNESKPRGNS